MRGWSAAARHRAAAYAVAGCAAVLGVTGLGVTGCVSSVPSPVQTGGKPSRPPGRGPAPASAAATAGQAATATAPLTGLPVSPAAASRPAIALVVTGPDPRGLSAADVVFEEITAPSVRYIAVFQSMAARTVGPITSTRPADGMALSVLHPLTGYDGGSAGFLQVLQGTGVIDAGYLGHSSIYKSGPAGLTTSTTAIGRAASDTAPPQLFEYRGEGPGSDRQLATAGVQLVSVVRVTIPGAPTQTWTFDASADRWVQTGGGPRVGVANLVIQTVAYKQVFLSHRTGVTVPSARVIGTGHVLVVTGAGETAQTGQHGLAAPGTWSKPGLRDTTNFLDIRDLPMALQPGPTWVILAPHGTRVAAG